MQSSSVNGPTCTPWSARLTTLNSNRSRSGSPSCLRLMESLATARSGTSHYTSALRLGILMPPGSSSSSSPPRAAEVSGGRRRVPAHPDGPLQRPGDPGESSRGPPRAGGAPAHPSAPGLPVLLGHVPGDGRAVQRLTLRRHIARRSGADPQGTVRALYQGGPANIETGLDARSSGERILLTRSRWGTD